VSNREEWEMSMGRAEEERKKSEIQKESNTFIFPYKMFEFMSIRIFFDYLACSASLRFHSPIDL